MALEARLRREADRAERETAHDLHALAVEPVRRKRADARARLARLVWTEAEDIHTARYWNEGVDRLLDAAERDPGFAEKPLEALVEDLAATLKAHRAPSDKPQPRPIGEVRWVMIDPGHPDWPKEAAEIAAEMRADTS
jgi:hypothetical protein